MDLDSKQKLLRLQKLLYALQEIIVKMRQNDFYNYIYDFCSLSNSLREYLIFNCQDIPGLSERVKNYPIIEIPRFDNKFLNFMENLFENVPWGYLSPLNNYLTINIYPAKRQYLLNNLKNIDSISEICSALIEDVEKRLNAE